MTNEATHQVVRRPPADRVRAHLDRDYQGYVESNAAGDREVRTPTGKVAVIVGLGAAMLHFDGERPPVAHSAFVAGLHEAHTVTEALGPSFGVQVDFTPIGAYLFFGEPMSAMSNRVIQLDAVLGAEGRDLLERVHEASNWEARFTLPRG